MGDPKGKGFYYTFVADPSVFGEEVISSRPKLARGRHWEPRADVVEEPARILVTFELSGVTGDEITLVFIPERNSLAIKGSREEWEYSSKRIAHQLEISFGTFEREIDLPNLDLDGQHISAQYRNGFLFVSIPKLSQK